jgi:hypothetical protein
MTKGRAAGSLRMAAQTVHVQRPIFHGSVVLPFVIPSEAEGSAV